MAAKIYFPIVESAPDDAITLVLEKGAVFIGNSKDENLACGSCKYVFGRNLSTQRFIGTILKGATNGAYLQCHCGALNLIKSKSDTS